MQSFLEMLSMHSGCDTVTPFCDHQHVDYYLWHVSVYSMYPVPGSSFQASGRLRPASYYQTIGQPETITCTVVTFTDLQLGCDFYNSM